MHGSLHVIRGIPPASMQHAHRSVANLHLLPPQGASFLPYLITDGIVAPDSCRHCYSENLALMPNCYFVNDYKHAHMVRGACLCQPC